MITTIIVLLAGLLISLVIILFSVLNFVFPPQITAAIEYFVSYLGYIGHIFPINTLMQALGTYLLFLTLYYSSRLIWKLIQMIPFIAPNTELHDIEEKKSSIMTSGRSEKYTYETNPKKWI